MTSRWLQLLAAVALLGGCGDSGPGLTLRSGAVLVEDGEGGVPALPAPQRPVAGAPAGARIVHGLVEPVRFEEVSFEVPGIVKEVLVKGGQTIHRGQVLGTLETEDRQARLDDSRRRLRAARRALPAGRQRRGGELPGYLQREMQARLAEVKEQAKYRARDQRDFQKRVSRGADEEEMRDRVLELAKRRNDKPRTSAIRRAHQEQLAVALADDVASRVRQLEDALKHSTLKSPIDGVVVGVSVRPGQAWNTRGQDAAFEVIDPSVLVVRADIPKVRADSMTPRELVWIELDGRDVVQGGVRDVKRGSRERVDPETGETRLVRQVTFALPATLPPGVEVGSEARVALQP